MRRLLLILSFLIFSAPFMDAQDAYFCTTEGRELTYVRKYVSDGRVKWTHTLTVGTVSGTSGGGRHIEYTSEFRKAGGGGMYGGPISLYADVDPSGNVDMDISASLSAVFRNIFPKVNVHSEGASTVLPNDMKAGDILPDASCTVHVGALKYVTSVTDRHVLRTETVTTDAGTFDCIVVSEHKVEKGPGRNRVTTAHTWYCRNLGMVRHDTYDKNSILETSEILEKIR